MLVLLRSKFLPTIFHPINNYIYLIDLSMNMTNTDFMIVSLENKEGCKSRRGNGKDGFVGKDVITYPGSGLRIDIPPPYYARLLRLRNWHI